jgi:hypothetical protein
MTEPAPTEPANTEPATKPPGPPPKWKFAVIVLLGLYPLLVIIIPLMGRVFDTPYLGVPISTGSGVPGEDGGHGVDRGAADGVGGPTATLESPPVLAASGMMASLRAR